MLQPQFDDAGQLIDDWLNQPLEPTLRGLPGLTQAVSLVGTRCLGSKQVVPDTSSGVSVIIPAYNSARTLARAVRSALTQTLPPQEVIVVDDGSSDETRKLVRALQDRRIRYLWQANQGPAAARNHGLAAAQGEFLAFLDADDYWRPGFLQACVEFLSGRPEAIAVSTGHCIKRVGRPDLVYPEPGDGEQPQGPILIDDFFTFWAAHDHIRTGSSLLRKSIVDRAGGQLTCLRSTEDLEYWGYLATFGKWGFIPEPLWVGDSERAAAVNGWFKKYSSRRRHCPTVDEWQQRILPRLQEHDRRGFELMRWRIATSLAQVRILSGERRAARKLVADYAQPWPRSWMTELLKLGHRLGSVAWQLACLAIVAREFQKVACMGLKVRLGRAWDTGSDAMTAP